MVEATTILCTVLDRTQYMVSRNILLVWGSCNKYVRNKHISTHLKIIQNASRVSLRYVYKGCARHAFKGERVK